MVRVELKLSTRMKRSIINCRSFVLFALTLIERAEGLPNAEGANALVSCTRVAAKMIGARGLIRMVTKRNVWSGYLRMSVNSKL